ncbi:MAG: hypothetical protein ACFFCS_09005 [Candidatus Hodarchaeota archaeon]
MSNRDFPEPVDVQFCTNCGQRLEGKEIQFCPSCGKEVGAPASNVQLDFTPVDQVPIQQPMEQLASERPVGIVSTVQGTAGAEIYDLKRGQYLLDGNLYNGRFSITTQGLKFVSSKVESFVLLFQGIQNAMIDQNPKFLVVQMTNGQVFQFKVSKPDVFVKVIMQYKWTFDKKNRA